MPEDPNALAELATELATSAGELALRRRVEGFSVSSKTNPTDIVTDADRAVESFLVEEIRRRRPQDSVLGEEHGTSGVGDSGYRWVVDPIDGTVNFMLGIPDWTVSVAVQSDGRTVAGCVVNPSAGQAYTAALGHGAWSGGRRLSGPRSVPLAEAVFGTGFGYSPARRGQQARVAAEVLGRTANMRRIGSAAQDLCYIAAGRLDLYFEAGLNEWDYAAGVLIAQEAGCATTGRNGAAPDSALVAAAHPDNAGEFFGLLDELMDTYPLPE